MRRRRRRTARFLLFDDYPEINAAAMTFLHLPFCRSSFPRRCFSGFLGAALLASGGCSGKKPVPTTQAATPSAPTVATVSPPPPIPAPKPASESVAAEPSYALFPKIAPRIAPSVAASQEVALADPPAVCEFVVAGPSGEGKGETHVRGVAVSADGKFLCLASAFATAREVSVPGLPQSASPPGWLARSEPWIVVPISGKFRPAPTAAPSRLDLSGPFLVLMPSANARNRIVTAMPALPPKEESASTDAYQWISIPPDNLLPGTPVLTSQKLLLGLIDEIRPDQNLARVARVQIPAPVVAEATHRSDPVPWGQEPYVARLPFTDPTIAPTDVSALLEGESDAALLATCDALLKAHGTSPLAWYAATRGYARAGKGEQALASAKMLTQLAPGQAEAWLLYGQQLAAAGKFAAAVDAYQTATERGALFHDVGLPVAVCLFRLGNTDAALDQIRTVLDKEPESYDIWIASGNMNRAAGKIAAAVDAYPSPIASSFDPSKRVPVF